MKKIIVVLLFLVSYMSMHAQTNWKIGKNSDVEIPVPSSMEVQSVECAKREKDLSEFAWPIGTLVLQPKGLNIEKKDASKNYARIILLKESSSTTNADLDIPKEELKEVSKQLNIQYQSNLGNSTKITKWYPTRTVKWGNKNVIHISYERQLNNSPLVMVNQYIFIHKGAKYSLTLSYRINEANLWKNDLEKVVNNVKYI